MVLGAEEAGGERDELALCVGRVATIEAGLNDLLDAPHVEELEDERNSLRSLLGLTLKCIVKKVTNPISRVTNRVLRLLHLKKKEA